jgi:hypothetical protein
MRVFLSVTVIAILLAGKTSAQDVNFGIKAGLNLYNINSSGSEYDVKTGFHAGLLGHIHLTKHFAVQPELVYSTQGAKYKVGGLVTKTKLSYINLPVLLQYMFDNGFRLQAGPQVGFLINAKNETGSTNTNIKKSTNTVDFALGMGVGYINPKSGFGVDARYNLGLSNINDDSNVKATNRGLQLGVFYLFKHK